MDKLSGTNKIDSKVKRSGTEGVSMIGMGRRTTIKGYPNQ